MRSILLAVTLMAACGVTQNQDTGSTGGGGTTGGPQDLSPTPICDTYYSIGYTGACYSRNNLDATATKDCSYVSMFWSPSYSSYGADCLGCTSPPCSTGLFAVCCHY